MHPQRGLPIADITALVALPYAEELWRCARVGRR